MVSHLSRLRDVVVIQTRQLTVVPLPPFVDETPAVQAARKRFNKALQDLLGDSGKLTQWPAEFQARQLRDGDGCPGPIARLLLPWFRTLIVI